MNYFLLRSNEDGTRIIQLTEKELLKRITPNEDGTTYYGSDLEFLDHIPESDKGCWMNVSDNAVLIIKGEIVKPKVVEIATKLEL